MLDSISLQASNAEETANCGASLASSIYAPATDILLHGDVGAGKTTFAQGLLRAMGVTQPVTSPTYALEQRYDTPLGEIIHIDCYRLSAASAKELLEQSDDHAVLRCIEWSERTEENILDGNVIHCDMQESPLGRDIRIRFADAPLPSLEQIDTWRREMHLPVRLQEHCNTVANMSLRCADTLLSRGIVVRREALHRAALLHDLFRFVDFKPSATPPNTPIPAPDTVQIWQSLREKFGSVHEHACVRFLEEQGFSTIARIIARHGLLEETLQFDTIEQKILFYADKRVIENRVATLDERFEDFAQRYGNGIASPKAIAWLRQSKDLEDELFPNGQLP